MIISSFFAIMAVIFQIFNLSGMILWSRHPGNTDYVIISLGCAFAGLTFAFLSGLVL